MTQSASPLVAFVDDRLLAAGSRDRVLQAAKRWTDAGEPGTLLIFEEHTGSQVDFDLLAKLLAELGADDRLVEAARGANTAKQVLDLATAAGLPLADAVAARARETALGLLEGATAVEVVVFDRAGQAVGKAAGWPS